MIKKLLRNTACTVSAHDWRWRYVADGACNQQRACSHCGKVEQRVAHEWGDRFYREDGSCTLDRCCARCGEYDNPTVAKHNWGDWQGYVANGYDGCASVCYCTRCGTASYSAQEAHVWGEPYF